MGREQELAEWRPASLPDPQLTLRGESVDLVPLDPDIHNEELWLASGEGHDPDLWRYMFYGPFEARSDFDRFVRDRAGSPGELFYAIVDRDTGKAGGVASYLRMVPGHGRIEIGHIWFGGRLQKTRGATEAIFLLARHVFDDLGYRRLEWKCDARNERSRTAAVRFGFAFEGEFREHMVVKSRNRDTAWFAVVDEDWPVVRRAFDIWLGPDNFDETGRQHRGLVEIRDELKSTKVRIPTVTQTTIRDPVAEDGNAWRLMWREYNDFYNEVVPDEVTASTWGRILDPSSPIGCLLALRGGYPAGFANYVIGPYTWSDRPRCLMEDLYVKPDYRSAGIGRELIQALVERSQNNGWTQVYWITQSDNLRARRLYEAMTAPDGFIQYTVEVDERKLRAPARILDRDSNA